MTASTAFLQQPHPTIAGHDTITCVALSLGNDCWMMAAPGTPVNGVAGTGTGAGFAGPGSVFIDTTAGNWYINGGAGTKASPVWKLVTHA